MEYKGEVYSVKKSCLKEQSASYESVDPFDVVIKKLLGNKKEFTIFLKTIESSLYTKEWKAFNMKQIEYLPKYNQEGPEVVFKDENLEIYYVIKHKKKTDIDVPFMMLESTTQLIRQSIEEGKKEKKGYRIPIVIPIVIYTGIEQWDIPLELKKLQVFNSNLFEDLMNQKYILIDMNQYNLKALLDESKIIEAIYYERHRRQDSLIKMLEEL